jgi:tRNA wybutosine-synthesizing protein 3
MVFNQQKKDALNNLCASERLQDVDENLKPLLTLINKKKDYYTTSSCSGRITLLEDRGGKGDDKIQAKWHKKVTLDELLHELKKCGGKIWFKYECPIIHVVARDADKASKLLVIAHEAGFKRAGIHSIKKERVLLEILSTERIELPVTEDGQILVDSEHLSRIVAEANRKYEVGLWKLEKLAEKISRLN